MNEKKTINASTIARIAGNIAAGMMSNYSAVLRVITEGEHQQTEQEVISVNAVLLARAIAAEVERTEPVAEPPQP